MQIENFIKNRRNQFEQLILLGVLVFFAIKISNSSLIERMDVGFYDVLITHSRKIPADDVVIVAIDDHSLAQLGRWPWSRRVHAELLDKLSSAGALAVGYDVLFSEPDINDPEGDELFTQSLSRNKNVVLAVAPLVNDAGTEVTSLSSIPKFSEAAAQLGHVDIRVDSDGIARGLFLRGGPSSPRYSALPLAMLELVYPYDWSILPGELNPQLGHYNSLHWVRDYCIYVPISEHSHKIQRISFSKVLNDPASLSIFHNKFVLVGVTALGITETINTPAFNQGHLISGVEFNANVLASLLNKAVITPLNSNWSMAITVLFAFLPAVIFPLLRPMNAFITVLGLIITVGLISGFLLYVQYLWYSPMAAIICLVLSYPLWSWRRLEYFVLALSRQEQLNYATLHSIADGIIAVDQQQLVTYMNPNAELLTGYTFQEAEGQEIERIFKITASPNDANAVAPTELCQRLNVNSHISNGTLKSRQGTEYAVRLCTSPIYLKNNKRAGTVFAFSDITNTLSLTQQMVHMATHDTVTSLPNRSLLFDRLKHALANAKRTEQSLALLFLDLDNFKKINDTLGHAAGDVLLRQVATRLVACVRRGDTVARLGGDEFIVLLENFHDPDSIVQVAHKILQALSKSFHRDNTEMHISTSIGISVFPKDGDDSELLVKRADSAMYRAKQSGRNCFRFYSKQNNEWTIERLNLEKYLRSLISKGNLELFYQPQMDIKRSVINSVEALIRVPHPQQGYISSMKVIRLAEDTGLIIPLGEWVMETACEQAKQWNREGVFDGRIAVNFSPQQISQRDIYQFIKNMLSKTQLLPHMLEIEITETLFMKDLERIVVVMRSIQELGVRFSLDDFGTGYSSLSYLKRLPINQLKIDQSFVRDVTQNSQADAVAQGIISLAHSLDLSIIAEGVETESQAQFFRRHNCFGLQGHYFSKPLPLADMTAFFRDNRLVCLPAFST